MIDGPSNRMLSPREDAFTRAVQRELVDRLKRPVPDHAQDNREEEQRDNVR